MQILLIPERVSNMLAEDEYVPVRQTQCAHTFNLRTCTHTHLEPGIPPIPIKGLGIAKEASANALCSATSSNTVQMTSLLG